jgi:uncharacterized membrane protein YkgB
MNQLNRLILSVSGSAPFLSDLDRHLIRVAMVFIFFAFSIQKWNAFTAEMLVPLISHSPVVFWIIPAFGIRGAGYFLGTTETIFGALILLGYWSPKLGILGALGSIVTFVKQDLTRAARQIAGDDPTNAADQLIAQHGG